MATERYDIFISYAREDIEWVQEHLYAPLQKCRTKDGRTPRIFFDIGEEGIAIGENFLTAITHAIEKARRIVPVYSPNYFRKKMCRYELNLALQCHVMSDEGKLLPILKDPEVAGQVPFAVRAINYWTITDPTWFARLCAGLEVAPAAALPQLAFQSKQGPATARITLPPVKVAVRQGGDVRASADDEIAISGDGAVLEGTFRQKAVAGVATFADLIVAAPATGVRLVASAPGMDAVRSDPFDVLAPPTPPRPPDPPTIAADGEAVFFASGKAVLLLGSGTTAVYDLAGKPLLSDVPLVGRVRLVRRAGGLIAVADWTGNVWLFSDEGQHRTWAFGGGKGGFVVPGGIAFDGPIAYIGFWSGLVFQVSLAGGTSEVLRHEAGVQTLAVAGGRCYISDFGEAVAVYHLETRRLVNSGPLERAIWLLRPTPDGLLAVGDKFAYQIGVGPFQIHREELPAGATAGVFADTARPVLVGSDGAGLRVDPKLVFRPRFRVAAGAEPVGADDRGTYCVCAAPDGRRTLLQDGKVVYSHADGTLAVSPGGDRFALGERGGVRVVDAAAFGRLVQGGRA